MVWWQVYFVVGKCAGALVEEQEDTRVDGVCGPGDGSLFPLIHACPWNISQVIPSVVLERMSDFLGQQEAQKRGLEIYWCSVRLANCGLAVRAPGLSFVISSKEKRQQCILRPIVDVSLSFALLRAYLCGRQGICRIFLRVSVRCELFFSHSRQVCEKRQGHKTDGDIKLY